jgi:hypothetical protein
MSLILSFSFFRQAFWKIANSDSSHEKKPESLQSLTGTTDVLAEFSQSHASRQTEEIDFLMKKRDRLVR